MVMTMTVLSMIVISEQVVEEMMIRMLMRMIMRMMVIKGHYEEDGDI